MFKPLSSRRVVKDLLRARRERRWVEITYGVPQKDGTVLVTLGRPIKVYYAWQGQGGEVHFLAWCGLRQAIREFRSDRVYAITFGDPIEVPDDKVVVYPDEWGLISSHGFRLRPLLVDPDKVDEYEKEGWTASPNGVIERE